MVDAAFKTMWTLSLDSSVSTSLLVSQKSGKLERNIKMPPDSAHLVHEDQWDGTYVWVTLKVLNSKSPTDREDAPTIWRPPAREMYRGGVISSPWTRTVSVRRETCSTFVLSDCFTHYRHCESQSGGLSLLQTPQRKQNNKGRPHIHSLLPFSLDRQLGAATVQCTY